MNRNAGNGGDAKAVVDAVLLRAALLGVAQEVEAKKDFLCEIDASAGDGDHGVAMTIGMRAVTKALGGETRAYKKVGVGAVWQAVADAFADDVGASIGPIYEAAFESAARAVGSDKAIVGVDGWLSVFEAMVNAMESVGGAHRGDKTLLDAWWPAVDALYEARKRDADMCTGLRDAASAAEMGALATREMIATVGRASRLGARSKGKADAGAMSAAIIMKALVAGLGCG